MTELTKIKAFSKRLIVVSVERVAFAGRKVAFADKRGLMTKYGFETGGGGLVLAPDNEVGHLNSDEGANYKIGYMVNIETKNLVYTFGGHEKILWGLDLKVPEGCIYGFLGPNGAGKTTTLRLLLGLLKKQGGEIRLFDKSLAGSRIEILRKTGSLDRIGSVEKDRIKIGETIIPISDTYKKAFLS